MTELGVTSVTDQRPTLRLEETNVSDAVADDAAPATGHTVFDVQDLSVYYGPFRAVRNVNLEVRQHEITAFIGPSGCGKTTVLRCFNRMNDFIETAKVEGRIDYHGVDLYDPQVNSTEVRRRIGMVFQKPNPFPKSIYDNVAYGPKLGGMKKKSELDEVVERSLKGAALWDEVKDRLKSSGLGLSGGQQQRLCIARAIAVDPEVILMDEPCSALDPRSTARIEELIVQLAGSLSVVIVTHNLAQAKRIADYAAYLLNGDLIEQGLAKKVFEDPDNQSTRDFVAGMFG